MLQGVELAWDLIRVSEEEVTTLFEVWLLGLVECEKLCLLVDLLTELRRAGE